MEKVNSSPQSANESTLQMKEGSGGGFSPPAFQLQAADANPNSGSGGPIQRKAFVDDRQIGVNEPGLSAAQLAFVNDDAIRDYRTMAEFNQHAAGNTDYLGNLPGPMHAGTWVRFSPVGINLLGERHTEVTLDQVTNAVGTQSFIYERFSSDDLSQAPGLSAAYENENQEEFQQFGIQDEANKRQYGAESLFPKMGYAMAKGLPFFNGTRTLAGISNPRYLGKPLQTYVKLAWGYSFDNLAQVTRMTEASQAVPAPLQTLATLHPNIVGEMNAFVAQFQEGGYIGDLLSQADNAHMLPILARFAQAFSDVMVHRATEEPGSRLSEEQRNEFRANGANDAEKNTLFSNWRNHMFDDQVQAAAGRGVRYAGMGNNHLIYLHDNGLVPGNGHEFNMIDGEMAGFTARTAALNARAVDPAGIPAPAPAPEPAGPAREGGEEDALLAHGADQQADQEEDPGCLGAVRRFFGC